MFKEQDEIILNNNNNSMMGFPGWKLISCNQRLKKPP